MANKWAAIARIKLQPYKDMWAVKTEFGFEVVLKTKTDSYICSCVDYLHTKRRCEHINQVMAIYEFEDQINKSRSRKTQDQISEKTSRFAFLELDED